MLRFNTGLLLDAASDGAGGGGGTPAFDQAAFQAQILDGVNKAMATSLAAFTKSYKADLAKLTPAPAAAVTIEEPVVDPAAGAVKTPADPAMAAELRAVQRQNKELADRFAAMKTESDATRVAAERKEQDATVRTMLSKYKYADDAAAEDAFEIFGGKVKRNEEGAFVGNDGTPLAQFLEEGLRSKPYLLAPKDVGGAGARGGRTQAGDKPVQFESIKPGMSMAEINAAAAQISAVLQNGQR